MSEISIIGPLAVAAVLAVYTSTRLAWRLFLFVPLAGQIAMLCYPWQSPGLTSSLQFLVEHPSRLIWVLICFVYGAVFVGPWAVILGELGWLIIKAASLPSKYSRKSLFVIISIVGAGVGVCYHLISYNMEIVKIANTSLRLYSWSGVWFAASVIAGTLGGFLVISDVIKDYVTASE